MDAVKDGGIMYLLTSVMMFRRNRKTHNRPVVDIGLYLDANGTRDRVITFLARLGICPSIDTIRRRREEIRVYAEVCSVSDR